MLFSQLKGGLGNILFIVAALKSLSLERNIPFVVSNNTQSSKKRDEEDFWINSVLKNIKKVNKRPNDIKVRYNEKTFRYKKIPETKHGLEINGYFQSEKYFKKYKNEIIELFTSYKKQIIGKLNKKLSPKNKTISIHIRRTDYVKLQHAHVVQDINYYKTSLEKMSSELGYNNTTNMNDDYTFIVFSDDIEWCKNHELFSSFKNIKFMENNTAIEDIYLMSMCDHNIIANSTFSWWGAYLNINKDKVVICPSKWFNPSYIPEEEWQDIYCDKWIVN